MNKSELLSIRRTCLVIRTPFGKGVARTIGSFRNSDILARRSDKPPRLRRHGSCHAFREPHLHAFELCLTFRPMVTLME